MFCDEHGTQDYCGECLAEGYKAEIARLTADLEAARAENARLAEDKEKWRDIAHDWKQLYRELTDHLRATLGAKVDQPTTPKDKPKTAFQQAMDASADNMSTVREAGKRWTSTGRTHGGRDYERNPK